MLFQRPGGYRARRLGDHAGFALMELAVMLAVVGILAAIAVPQYQDYVVRAQFAEGLNLASGQKAAVLHEYTQAGECPYHTVNIDGFYGNSPGLPVPEHVTGKYVESVEVYWVPEEADNEIGYGDNFHCTISAWFKEEGVAIPLQGKGVMLRLVDTEGSIRWDCETTVQEQRYVPSACRAGRKFLYDWVG